LRRPIDGFVQNFLQIAATFSACCVRGMADGVSDDERVALVSRRDWAFERSAAHLATARWEMTAGRDGADASSARLALGPDSEAQRMIDEEHACMTCYGTFFAVFRKTKHSR
jgi:hypothetical protein